MKIKYKEYEQTLSNSNSKIMSSIVYHGFRLQLCSFYQSQGYFPSDLSYELYIFFTFNHKTLDI